MVAFAGAFTEVAGLCLDFLSEVGHDAFFCFGGVAFLVIGQIRLKDVFSYVIEGIPFLTKRATFLSNPPAMSY